MLAPAFTRTPRKHFLLLQGGKQARYKGKVNSIRTIMLAAALTASAPAFGESGSLILVNGTGQAMSGLSIRPAAGGDWKPLGSGSAGPGSRQPISFEGETCAYDIRASIAGAEVTWNAVNLCDTKSVTLNRRADGTRWADYD